ncbi:MAG: aminotransferase class I/II-fold pyridoxal phosphate-dependent enzyme, partial [Candidatus Brocadiia bacterium]
PVYRNSTLLSGAVPYAMPLRVENGFLPIFDDIPHDVASRAVLMYLNYPNNPTGAVADLRFLRSAVEFARKYDIIIAYDHAYSELVFDGRRSPSILEVEGSRELCVEFNSLSKIFNATGWRLAWAVGSREVLESLNSLKKNIDSGVFMAIQEAGAFALDNLIEATSAKNVSIYEQRRDVFVQTLREGGWDVSPPHGTFYIWARIPGNSCKAAARLLRETGVVCVPGIGYGEYGEGYIRFALNLEVQRVAEAARRLSRAEFSCENGETLVHS